MLRAFSSTNLGEIVVDTDRLMSTNQSQSNSRINGHLYARPWLRRRLCKKRSGVLPEACVCRFPPECTTAKLREHTLSTCASLIAEANQTRSFLATEPFLPRFSNK